MFCLRSFNPTVSFSILKLTTNRGVCQSHRVTHIRAPVNIQSIFGGSDRQPFGSQSTPLPESLPLVVPVDEENVPGYRPQYLPCEFRGRAERQVRIEGQDRLGIIVH
jgi:hypothetical protein